MINFKMMLKKDLYELVCECVTNDNSSFISDEEKDFFLCMLKHFFTVNNYNDFHKIEIDLETFKKYYKKTIELYHSEMKVEYLEQIFIYEAEENTK